MWGTPLFRLKNFCIYRFIPTHVGNSPHRCRGLGLGPVHPHACGELCICHELKRQGCGSSPRMWGTQSDLRGRGGSGRFIPTHVGNSLIASDLDAGDTVHPHACGELLGNGIRIVISLGSSPRMWGTPEGRVHPEPRGRFIPTHVGNSYCVAPGRCREPVHPHACGELVSPREKGVLSIGSSPRMWGTPISTKTGT